MPVEKQSGPQPDPFVYGRRQVIRYDKTGQPSYSYLPLQPEDFLNPQEGDEFAHGPRHDALVQHVRRLFRHVHRYQPETLVLSNVQIRWPQPGLPQPAPDLAVIPGVTHPDEPRRVFDVAKEGAAPPFVLEVLSPLFAQIDRLAKSDLYAKAGVAEYFMLEAAEGNGRHRIDGYRLHDGGYATIAPDDRGRLWSETNRLWLGVERSETVLFLVDGRTGRRIDPPAEEEIVSAAAQAEGAFRAQSIAAQLDLLRKPE
jgi:Uma2 family endonuclease